MNISRRLLKKLLPTQQFSNHKSSYYKIKNKLFAVSCLITLIAALTIISPAQNKKASSATALPNTLAIFLSSESYDIFGWIYGAIFPEPEKKAEEENQDTDTPPTSAVTTDFEDFTPGTINGQKDWKSSGDGAYGSNLDVEISDNNSLFAPKSFGSRSLRLSNAYTSDSLAEQTFAGLLPNEGGETSADNLGEKRGERKKMFSAEWEFASADPNSEQYGLSVVASPTRRDGSQMSYVRMVDTPEGIAVFFKEYRNGSFSEINIANGLDRAQAHKIRLEISFNEGAGNDNVGVYVDDELKHQGTTWEDYYRNEAKTQPPTIDTISFNTNGSPYPANRGKGFLIDNIEINSLVAPSVLSITRLTPLAQITNASTVVFRVVFDVAVNSVDSGDFDFMGSTVGTPQITNINSGSPFTTYDVTVTNYTVDGNLQLNVIVNPTNPIRSVTGNDPIVTGKNDGQPYTIDTTAPIVSSIILTNPNPTTADNIQFTVQFSENVQGVDTGDFDLITQSGTVTGTINLVTQNTPSNYTVLVTGVTGDGDLRLDLDDDDSITDFVAATPGPPITPFRLGGDGVNNGDFTGQFYTVDNTNPTATVSYSGADPTNVSPIVFTVNFSESVTVFGDVAADYTVTNGTVGTITGSGSGPYSVPVTPTVINGAVTFQVNAGAAADAATNPNTISNTVSVTYDGAAPTVTVNKAATQVDPTSGSPIRFTALFSEPVTGFDATDVSVTGTAFTGTPIYSVMADFSCTGFCASYTITVSGMSQTGTVDASIPMSSAAMDTSGNQSSASTSTDGSVFYAQEIIYALTTETPQRLITFAAQGPGAELSTVNIGGLGTGETLAGIDFRPSTISPNPNFRGVLYGLSTNGSIGRLYSINTDTGAATRIGTTDYILGNATEVGFDFNPVVDRIRVITNATDALNNFRLHPDTGAVVMTAPLDVPLNGDTTVATGAAYINNDNDGATGTQLYDINGGFLYTQGSMSSNPNLGVTTIVGTGLGVTPTDVNGFDISSNFTPAQNVAYAAFTVGAAAPVLYNVDLATGLASSVGSIGTLGSGVSIRGLAVAPPELYNIPTVSIDSPTAVAEGTDVVFTVSLSNTTTRAVTVNYTVANVTTSNADFPTAPTTGSLVIPACPTLPCNGTITVQTTDDLIDEAAAETFTVTLNSAIVGAIAASPNNVGTGTINDNDATPTVSITNTITGSEAGPVANTFTVTLSDASGLPVMVSYATSDNLPTPSATAGSDYMTTVGTFTFNPGDPLTQTFTVPTIDDSIFEPTETFTATLSSPSNATLGTATATGTIANDGASVVSINPTSSANEGDNVVFDVSINEPNANIVTVNYTFADVSTSATDRTAPSGTVTIPAEAMSAQIIVPALNDNEDEPNETFTITLTSADNGTTVDTANDEGVGTIVDTDVLTVYVNDNFANPTPGQDPDGPTGPATNFGLDAFATVQGGVTGVAVGGTVIVYDGTYIEQVFINKDLTVDGESTAGTVIKVPSPATSLTLNSLGEAVIVNISGGATVGMQDLTVSGTFTYPDCSAPYFDGIYVLGGATLNMSDAAILDIRYTNPSFYGCQNGFALAVGGGAEVGTANVTNVTFDGYDKEAVYVDGAGASVNVQNSTFIGEGPSNNAQNIFQISSGATAIINNSAIGTAGFGSQCTVPYNPPPPIPDPNHNPGCGPTLDAYQGSGVALFDAGAVQLTNNTFTDNDIAISAYGSNGALTVTNNTFSGNRYFGMLLSQGTTTATGNTMTAPMNVGVAVYTDGDDTGNAVLTFNQNTITGATTGLQMLDFDLANIAATQTNSSQIIRGVKKSEAIQNNGTPTTTVPQLDANYNRIISTTAIDNPQNHSHNLQFNWWGCNAGPGNLPANAGCGAVVGTGANFTPWVVLTATASDTSINPGGTSTISSDLSKDSGGNSLPNTPTTSIPNTPVAFTATEGFMSACTMDPEPSAINCLLSNNLVDTSLFTSNSSNDATAIVEVDNETITLPITVNAPTFAIDSISEEEGDSGTTNFVFTVTKTGTTAFTTTVDYATSDVSATSPSDYTAIPANPPVTTLTFLSGELTKQITVAVNGDTMFEGDETFNVNLTNPVGATVATTPGVGTIENDDDQPEVQFDITPPFSGNEGDVNSTITIEATRTGALGDAFDVDVTFTNATATGGANCGAGIDFVNAAQQFEFAAGESSKTLTVPICGDTIFEGDETFTAILGTPDSPVILGTPATATVTIVEGPETQPTVSISDAVGFPITPTAEGNSATFNVTLSNTSDEQIDVNVSISPGTAGASDYSLVTTSVSFAPGEIGPKPVTVNALTDNLFEGPTAETFTVNLALGMTNNNVTIANGTGAGSISDVNVCSYTVNPTTATFGINAGSGSFVVSYGAVSGCPVSATSNAAFITNVVVGSETLLGGIYSRTVSYSVDSNNSSTINNGAARSGTISVTGVSFTGTYTVNQAADAVDVFIPTDLSGLTGTELSVPVKIASTITGRNAKAFEFTVQYDPAVLTPILDGGLPAFDTTDTMAGAAGFGVITNNPIAGIVNVSGSSTDPLVGFETLIKLRFTVTGMYNTNPTCTGLNFVPYTNSNVTFPAFEFNTGVDPIAATTNGQACVVAGNVNGRVVYGNPTTTTTGVPGVTLKATSPGNPDLIVMTDPMGNYSLSGFISGTYTVTPTKAPVPNTLPSLQNPIRTADAGLIQRYRLGLISLTARQLIAADVDGNDNVQTFDASLIQQYRLLTMPVDPTNGTGNWKFIPINKVYPSVPSNLTNENYDAILLGDVDGDYVSNPFRPNGNKPDGEDVQKLNVENQIGGVPVTLPNASYGTGLGFDIPVGVGNLTAADNVTAYEFDLVYRNDIITPVMNSANRSGTLSSNFFVGSSVISTNGNMSTIRVSAFSGNGQPIIGSGVLINLGFTAIGQMDQVSPLSFSDFIFNTGTPGYMAGTGQITILRPSAASVVVSGKLLTSTGRGVSNARVILTDTNGVSRTATSNSFGNYRFEGVVVGQTYIVSVASKSYSFTPRTISVVEDVTNFDIIAEP